MTDYMDTDCTVTLKQSEFLAMRLFMKKCLLDYETGYNNAVKAGYGTPEEHARYGKYIKEMWALKDKLNTQVVSFAQWLETC